MLTLDIDVPPPKLLKEWKDDAEEGIFRKRFLLYLMHEHMIPLTIGSSKKQLSTNLKNEFNIAKPEDVFYASIIEGFFTKVSHIMMKAEKKKNNPHFFHFQGVPMGIIARRMMKIHKAIGGIKDETYTEFNSIIECDDRSKTNVSMCKIVLAIDQHFTEDR